MSRTLKNARVGVRLARREKPQIIEEEVSVPQTPIPRKKNIGDLTEEESDALRALHFVDGTPILTPYVTYEILDTVKRLGFTATLEFLSSSIWQSEEQLVLALPQLQEFRNKVRNEMLYSQETVEVTEGVFKCPYCGSMKTTVVEKQIRGCDEPTTQIVTCKSCTRVKRYN